MNKEIMKQLGFGEEVAKVESGICPTCGEGVGKFRDHLSEKEYKISGMCQNCQDKIFGE
jgi:hypothetical protein